MDINTNYFDSTELEHVIRERLKAYKLYTAKLEEQITDVAADAADLKPAQTGRAMVGRMTVVVFNHDGRSRSTFELTTYVM